MELFNILNFFQVIFVGLQKELVKNCDGELKTELCQIAAFYEHRLQKGNKAIYHMEAFVAKFMAIFMKFVEDTFGGFLDIPPTMATSPAQRLIVWPL